MRWTSLKELHFSTQSSYRQARHCKTQAPQFITHPSLGFSPSNIQHGTAHATAVYHALSH